MFAAEDLARGEGSTNFYEAQYSEVEYTVNRTQLPTRYYDDDLYTDPTLIDAKLRGLAEAFVNSWTAKAIAEFDKSENQAEMSTYALAD